MTIEVHIQHPYAKYDKALKVTTYNPTNEDISQVFILEPGSSRLTICLHGSVAYKVEEVPSGGQQS